MYQYIFSMCYWWQLYYLSTKPVSYHLFQPATRNKFFFGVGGGDLGCRFKIQHSRSWKGKELIVPPGKLCVRRARFSLLYLHLLGKFDFHCHPGHAYSTGFTCFSVLHHIIACSFICVPKGSTGHITTTQRLTLVWLLLTLRIYNEPCVGLPRVYPD